MAYTTINKPSEHFNTKLYTGNGSTNAITGVGFQPDWVWIKRRDVAAWHYLFDSIRGANKTLYSNLSSGESTDTNNLQSFDSDGFTVGTQADMNQSAGTFASWNWKANGAGSSNTDGDITSTVSANQTAGFSLVKWTGNGTAGATVGHGLGSEMKFMILKDYSLSRTWITYHTSLGGGSGINFNETGTAGTSSAYWNDTDATSSVFSTGVYSNENNSNYICYCFAEKTGFSKFGKYTGNGNADGAFVYTGFKPAWVLIKHASGGTAGGESWNLKDVKRSTYNPSIISLFPNTTDGDNSTTNNSLDILSNGFKIRTVDNRLNNSGATYIYMAFAEAPLVGSNNVPCTAR